MNDINTEIAEGEPPAPRPREEHGPNTRADETTAMEVFFAWERLRIPYNLAIVIPSILTSHLANPPGADFLAAIIVCNICFCSGIVAEGYHCWIGINRKVARWSIFVVWCFISVLMILLTGWVA